MIGMGAVRAQQSAPTTPPATARVAPTAPPAGGGFTAWVLAKQADYNQKLAATIREIRTGDPLVATLLLGALSFAYGVLHAAGPGHGKAIISSYVLANERTVRRGIVLSFMAAFFQALIGDRILVAVLSLVFKAHRGPTRRRRRPGSRP